MNLFGLKLTGTTSGCAPVITGWRKPREQLELIPGPTRIGATSRGYILGRENGAFWVINSAEQSPAN